MSDQRPADATVPVVACDVPLRAASAPGIRRDADRRTRPHFTCEWENSILIIKLACPRQNQAAIAGVSVFATLRRDGSRSRFSAAHRARLLATSLKWVALAAFPRIWVTRSRQPAFSQCLDLEFGARVVSTRSTLDQFTGCGLNTTRAPRQIRTLPAFSNA